MTAWTEADLSRFGTAEEIEIAAVRKDGTMRAPADHLGGAGL